MKWVWINKTGSDISCGKKNKYEHWGGQELCVCPVSSHTRPRLRNDLYCVTIPYHVCLLVVFLKAYLTEACIFCSLLCVSSLFLSRSGCQYRCKWLERFISEVTCNMLMATVNHTFIRELFPLVLWHSLLGDRKGVRPVKELSVTIWLELWTTYGIVPVVTTASIIISFNKTG